MSKTVSKKWGRIGGDFHKFLSLFVSYNPFFVPFSLLCPVTLSHFCHLLFAARPLRGAAVIYGVRSVDKDIVNLWDSLDGMATDMVDAQVMERDGI